MLTRVLKPNSPTSSSLPPSSGSSGKGAPSTLAPAETLPAPYLQTDLAHDPAVDTTQHHSNRQCISNTGLFLLLTQPCEAVKTLMLTGCFVLSSTSQSQYPACSDSSNTEAYLPAAAALRLRDVLGRRMQRWLVSWRLIRNLKLSALRPLVPFSRAKGGAQPFGGTIHTMPALHVPCNHMESDLMQKHCA